MNPNFTTPGNPAAQAVSAWLHPAGGIHTALDQTACAGQAAANNHGAGESALTFNFQPLTSNG